MSYKIKHRTYDQLLSEVKSDLPVFDSAGMIDPNDYIKVALFVNKDLGLKLHSTKQVTVEIRNGRGKLPDDFDTFNFAYLMQKHTEIIPDATLTKTIVVPVPNYTSDRDFINVCIPPEIPQEPVALSCQPCNTQTHCTSCQTTYEDCHCVPSSHVRIDCKGNHTVVLQQYGHHVRCYQNLIKVHLVNSPVYVNEFCIDQVNEKINTIRIQNGFVYVNSQVKHGQLYLNYEGLLENDEGELLVMDHAEINMYYEYAIKKKILENAVMNEYPVTQNQIQLIHAEYRTSRLAALSIINTPDFDIMRRTFRTARKAHYAKYVKPFSSM